MNDLVSRQAAIDIAEAFLDSQSNGADVAMDIISRLVALDSVPERKAGKWIHGREIAREMIGDCITAIFYEDWKCSECGCIVEDGEPIWNFCPSCGAKMERSEE